MGELVDLSRVIRDRKFAKAISDLNEKISSSDIPSPEEFGWIPDQIIGGMVVSYKLNNSTTSIGYLDESCDYTYLEVNSDRLIYKMNLPELALGIEMGTL